MPIITWSETFPPKPTFNENSIADQHGRVFIVTGGASGCGYEVAKALYHLNGRVYIAGRDAQKAEAAIHSIISSVPAPHSSVQSGKGSLIFLPLDLNNLATIKSSAQEFLLKESRIDIIWHNAGVLGVPEGTKTAQGFEAHLGVNALGPFLFQHFLTPLCLKTASLPDTKAKATRIIFVTSAGHRGAPTPDGVNWDDLNMDNITGIKGGILKYGQSKAMNVMFAHEIARQYAPAGIVSLSVHPGSLKTGLQRHQPAIFTKITSPLLYDAHFGGLTELWAGFTEDVDAEMIGHSGHNGAYVAPWGRWGDGAKHVFGGLKNRKTGEKLWESCQELLKDWM